MLCKGASDVGREDLTFFIISMMTSDIYGCKRVNLEEDCRFKLTNLLFYSFAIWYNYCTLVLILIMYRNSIYIYPCEGIFIFSDSLVVNLFPSITVSGIWGERGPKFRHSPTVQNIEFHQYDFKANVTCFYNDLFRNVYRIPIKILLIKYDILDSR